MAKMQVDMPAGASNAFAMGAGKVDSDVKSSVMRQSGKAPQNAQAAHPTNSRGSNQHPENILGKGGIDRPMSKGAGVAPSRVERPVGEALRSVPAGARDMGQGHMGSWADREHPTK